MHIDMLVLRVGDIVREESQRILQNYENPSKNELKMMEYRLEKGSFFGSNYDFAV